MSRFFIDRPIFAWVLAIIVMLAGVGALFNMSVEQYPNIAPPTVGISATLPGASAEILENSVTQVIEQSLTGIDNLRYFSSSSDSDGNVSVALSFEPGTDPDVAQMQVQNKLQAAVPLLPIDVQQQGIRVSKANNNFLLVVGLYSEDGKVSQDELGDILFSDMRDEISRVNGVGSVNVFGNPHAMRVWLNPNKLAGYGLDVGDVVDAIKSQNIDVASGQVGGAPAVAGQELNATIKSQSKLRTAEEFRNIVVKGVNDGGIVRVKDVARVEVGSLAYGSIAKYRGKPAAGMIVILATGGNAIKTAADVKERVNEFKALLPKGVEVVYPYDSTPFIKKSIKSVVKTLVEAVVLVFIVMLLFLQNFRATLIPTIAVPVVMLGTFATLFAFGFTINTLTMFGMVLAIGLLVDDAIVVVENVERIMEEEGLSPLEATKKSSQQITGALIGVALVLSAVFVPMAFFKGSAGAIYRQFSITIVVSMIFSVLVALVLSPSLCATILKQKHSEHGVFARWFNRMLSKMTGAYFNMSSSIVKKWMRYVVVYGVLVGGMLFIFQKLPKSFLPTEDQGAMYLMMTTPNGSTLETTLKSVQKVEDYFLNVETNVEHLFTVAGFSTAGRAQNAGFGFIGLKDWTERKRPDQSVMAISGKAMGALSQIKTASIFTFFPPPIRELGNASGFSLELLDKSGIGHEALMQARNQLLGMASQNPLLVGVRPNGLNDVPQLKIDIDYAKALVLGVPLMNINQTIQTAIGSSYVNNFLDKGRIKRVFVQGDAKYRMSPNDVKKWYIKNRNGDMVSLASFVKVRWIYGPSKLERFSGVSSVNLQGSAIPGVSSGVAMNEMEKMIKKLPEGVGYAWSGLSYEEKKSQSQTLLLYAISVLVVFLSLAALYESWSVPFAVILTVPFGIVGAVVASLLFKMGNDVYFQVGLLTTIGLCAKNAILIVEFAKTSYEGGMSAVEASLHALRLRFRPIMMTSMAFLLGIVPLAIATGAGSASQRAIGVGVIGGVLMATFVAIVFVPMFYVMVQKISSKRS